MKQPTMDRKTQKKMIQFSKIIVASVTIAVTAMCCFAIWLCHQEYDSNGIVEVLGHYMDFAIIAFVSYSVNSISEKAIVNKVFNRRTRNCCTEDEEDGVG